MVAYDAFGCGGSPKPRNYDSYAFKELMIGALPPHTYTQQGTGPCNQRHPGSRPNARVRAAAARCILFCHCVGRLGRLCALCMSKAADRECAHFCRPGAPLCEVQDQAQHPGRSLVRHNAAAQRVPPCPRTGQQRGRPSAPHYGQMPCREALVPRGADAGHRAVRGSWQRGSGGRGVWTAWS
jgi:hypothetical protein